MSRIWRAELLRALAIWGAGTLVGWLLGYPFWGLFAATLLLLGDCWIKLRGIEQWLEDSKRPGPMITHGVWGAVLSRLYRWQRQGKKRKKRVRRAVSRFRSAIEASPDGAVVLGKGDEILWLNKPAISMLSLQVSHDVRRPITQIVRAPGFAEYLDTGQFDEPMEMASPADENLQLLLRVVPHDRDRRLLLVRDVTRLHRLEQVRKSFVANVSHELRSPLTVVLGYLESMSDDPELGKRWQRPLELMTQQAERMRLIVEDLLRLSQMESDPGGAPMIPIRLGEMLESIRGDALGLGENTHDIQIECEDELLLLGDYNELYSAFSNLIFNSVQYTPESGHIRLVWHHNDQGATLDVIDSGVGIEPHHLPRLTERFYRVDKARSRELGGTGLGLAIVKHVLARHNARLSIQSIPGEGSTFSCVFPNDRVCPARQSGSAGEPDGIDGNLEPQGDMTGRGEFDTGAPKALGGEGDTTSAAQGDLSGDASPALDAGDRTSGKPSKPPGTGEDAA